MYTSQRDYKIDCQKRNGKIRDQNPRCVQGKLILALLCSETNFPSIWDTATTGRKWTGYQLLLLAVELSQDYAHPPTVIVVLQCGGVGCPWVSFHLSRVHFITASLSIKQLLLEPSHRLSSPLCCVQNKHRKGYRGKCFNRCKLCLRHLCSYSRFCPWAWWCKRGFHQELLVMRAWKTVLGEPCKSPCPPQSICCRSVDSANTIHCGTSCIYFDFLYSSFLYNPSPVPEFFLFSWHRNISHWSNRMLLCCLFVLRTHPDIFGVT